MKNKNVIILGLLVVMVFSSVAMDQAVTPIFSIYNDGYWKPWKPCGEDSNIKNTVDSKKLNAVVKNNSKQLKPGNIPIGVSKRRKATDELERMEKYARHVKKLPQKDALLELYRHIKSDDFCMTHFVLEHHTELRTNSVIGIKLFGVMLKKIHSVDQFYEGFTEFPLNIGQMAESFAIFGHNNNFVKDWNLQQKNTEEIVNAEDFLELCFSTL